MLNVKYDREAEELREQRIREHKMDLEISKIKIAILLHIQKKCITNIVILSITYILSLISNLKKQKLI